MIKNKPGRKPKPSLRIACDGGSLSDNENYSGIRTITYNLIKELSRIDYRNTYQIFSFNPLQKPYIHNKSKQIKIYRCPRMGFFKIWLPLYINLFQSHIFLALSQAAPRINLPILGFVYDLAFLQYPKFYPDYRKLQHNTDVLISKAAHIITLSQVSKSAILKHYQISDEAVSVVYPGVSREFNPIGIKYIDRCPYFLFVGGLRKTKNIPFLIRSFKIFLNKINQPFKLVLIGDAQNLDQAIPLEINKLHLQKNVIIRHNINSIDLPKYYRGALAFISTSLAEGFGLPLLEAMACGIPVIAANNTSMPEVVGKAGLLVDTKNTPQQVAALFQIATQEKLRYRLGRQSLKQAQKFSWYRFARSIYNKMSKHCLIHYSNLDDHHG